MSLTLSEWLFIVYDAATIAAAIVAWRALTAIREQGRLMSNQIEQMRAAGRQTDDLIKIAREQAAALALAADASEKNAKAALLNAGALINSERPWIFVRHTIANENFRPLPTSDALLPQRFTFDLINSGRTPAEVLYSYFNYSIRPAREVDDVKIDEKELGKEFAHAKILPPGEISRFDTFYMSGSGLTAEDLIAIAASRMRLIIFGLIKYRDTLGGNDSQVRETWFYYFYNPTQRDLTMCGLPGANRHT
jgi:hypothetical protein